VDVVSIAQLTGWLASYGCLAVFVLVAVESMGIPVPGETMLTVAAVYAGSTQRLPLAAVIVAAALGGIVGDNLGYLLGRIGGYRLLLRYGRYLRLDERKLRTGRLLFVRHGGKTVFLGRFVAVLRMWVAVLAGTYRMPWRRFLLCNALGAVSWATVYGIAGYSFGRQLLAHGAVVGALVFVLGLSLMLTVLLSLHRAEARLARSVDHVDRPARSHTWTREHDCCSEGSAA
jgi:membrane protein DedA with SNARE-associated domain